MRGPGRVRATVSVVVAVLSLAALLGSATASAAPGHAPPAYGHQAPTGDTIGGVVFGRLPAGLGQRSDFAYHFARVDFASSVWESGPDRHGAYWVDLDADVMRGQRLATPRALHDWFIRYEDRPPEETHYRRTTVDGHRGWLCRDEAFWLIRPGLAVAVELDRRRWGRGAVVALADSVWTLRP